MGVYDKGKAGTVVETETSLAETGGDVYTKAVGRAFFLGQGNWGGPKGDECYTETCHKADERKAQVPSITLRRKERNQTPYTRYR